MDCIGVKGVWHVRRVQEDSVPGHVRRRAGHFRIAGGRRGGGHEDVDGHAGRRAHEQRARHALGRQLHAPGVGLGRREETPRRRRPPRPRPCGGRGRCPHCGRPGARQGRGRRVCRHGRPRPVRGRRHGGRDGGVDDRPHRTIRLLQRVPGAVRRLHPPEDASQHGRGDLRFLRIALRLHDVPPRRARDDGPAAEQHLPRQHPSDEGPAPDPQGGRRLLLLEPQCVRQLPRRDGRFGLGLLLRAVVLQQAGI